MPFQRSRKVLEEPGITKINLTTGPQAITGSTRMQATTIETFVVGNDPRGGRASGCCDGSSAAGDGRLGFEEGSRSARLREFARSWRR